MGRDLASVDGEVPVLIAGGGLVGLSTAMFLAQNGIASLAVERLRGGSPVPRAAFFHMRTMEMFRSAGIEDDVRRRSLEEFLPEGAIILMDTLAGKQLAALIPSLNEGVDALSPCRRLFVTQPGLEPILRARAEAAGARVIEGSEVVAVDQDGRGVTVTVRDAETSHERRLRAQYLVGADGAHSKVREILGIPLDGRGVFSNSITIYFHAPLAKVMEGKNLSVIYIGNPTMSGFFRLDRDCGSGFLVVSTVGDTSKPEAANPAADVSEPRLIEYVRTAAGIPDLPVKIDGVARWRATSDVARRYTDGRIFLAGDAAHLMPPNGGYGGNTGIHDGHNLAWKLALVLKGLAGPELLATYEAERRPVGQFTVEQAYTRYVTRSATYLGAKDFQPLANDFHIELGYLYRSAAVVPEDDVDCGGHEHPTESLGRPGARAPHLWLDRGGARVSTIDLFGRAFVLLAAPEGAAWPAAARAAASELPGLELDAHLVGKDLGDPEARFAAAFGLGSSGAALVRPDGFVAWRAPSLPADPAAALAAALRTILMRS